MDDDELRLMAFDFLKGHHMKVRFLMRVCSSFINLTRSSEEYSFDIGRSVSKVLQRDSRPLVQQEVC